MTITNKIDPNTGQIKPIVIAKSKPFMLSQDNVLVPDRPKSSLILVKKVPV